MTPHEVVKETVNTITEAINEAYLIQPGIHTKDSKIQNYTKSQMLSLLLSVKEMAEEEYLNGIYMYEPALKHFSDKLTEEINKIKEL